MGQSQEDVKVGPWSTVERPPSRSTPRGLMEEYSCLPSATPQEVTFEEPVRRHSWKDSYPYTLTAFLVSLMFTKQRKPEQSRKDPAPPFHSSPVVAAPLQALSALFVSSWRLAWSRHRGTATQGPAVQQVSNQAYLFFLVLQIDHIEGQKRYPKELLRQRFRRTFWCDLPQSPCFIG